MALGKWRYISINYTNYTSENLSMKFLSIWFLELKLLEHFLYFESVFSVFSFFLFFFFLHFLSFGVSLNICSCLRQHEYHSSVKLNSTYKNYIVLSMSLVSS